MLIQLRRRIPDLFEHLFYATQENFTKVAIYPPNATAYLCAPAAERLLCVHRALFARGLSLKIWDAYRPLSAQKKLWQIVPDSRFVADPAIGSRHNRGMAIDLTLIDLEGRELSMPTPFDEFSERASHSFSGCSLKSRQNREILRDAMVAEGFLPYEAEWWHYDAPEWAGAPLLDISFEELACAQS